VLEAVDAPAGVLADCQRVCAVPAPTFQEEERAVLVADLFREAGCQTRRDAVGNVVCALGDPDAPAVVFAAHLDTVFGREQPIEIVHDEERGRIIAPGIGDNSLGVAALLHLARLFGGRGPAARPLVLAATVGEEGLGDLRGAKHLLSEISCRGFVAIEGAMLDRIEIGGVGSTRYRVTYRGPGGHSWSDRGTPSAVHGLITRAAAFLSDRAPPNVSVNIGRIQGGTSINTIAAEAAIELDLRSEDAASLEGVAHRAAAHFGAAPRGIDRSIELIGQRPSGRTPPNHPIVQAAREARRRAGLEPAEEGTSSTDANAAYGRGIPAITVGVSTGGNAHRPDDYIDVEPIGNGLRALELVAEALVASA
jgi:acetylornithine deacetylase/succinyl-diaminopimelate desuccinylase-like protein